jgi:hypothetical protein
LVAIPSLNKNKHRKLRKQSSLIKTNGKAVIFKILAALRSGAVSGGINGD